MSKSIRVEGKIYINVTRSYEGVLKVILKALTTPSNPPDIQYQGHFVPWDGENSTYCTFNILEIDVVSD